MVQLGSVVVVHRTNRDDNVCLIVECDKAERVLRGKPMHESGDCLDRPREGITVHGSGSVEDDDERLPWSRGHFGRQWPLRTALGR